MVLKQPDTISSMTRDTVFFLLLPDIPLQETTLVLILLTSIAFRLYRIVFDGSMAMNNFHTKNFTLLGI